MKVKIGDLLFFVCARRDDLMSKEYATANPAIAGGIVMCNMIVDKLTSYLGDTTLPPDMEFDTNEIVAYLTRQENILASGSLETISAQAKLAELGYLKQVALHYVLDCLEVKCSDDDNPDTVKSVQIVFNPPKPLVYEGK